VIRLQLVVAVATFALAVYCLVGVIGTPADRVRNLPKLAWVVLVLLFPLLGSIAWLVAGRPVGGGAHRGAHRGAHAPAAFPEYDRPGRAAVADPQKDEEFLRRVRERAEEQRRRYEESRRPRPEQPEAGAQPDEPRQPEEPGDPAGADTGEE
jgi:hypothetical protein